MPNRPARFVSAIFASVLAGAPLAIISGNGAHAADECLLAPKDQTPQGSHWYYRIDHASKRHCWYLRAEGGKLSQSAPQNPSQSTEPTAPNAQTATQRSIANAHAELPPQTSIDPPDRNDAPVPANTATSENSAVAPSTAAPGSIVASRWLDPSAMSSAITPQPATSNTAANLPSDSATNDTAAATPAAVPPVAADASAADASQAQPASIPMLLAVMTGALALAGFTASIVLKFGGARARGTASSRLRRDKIWERADHDDVRLPAYPDSEIVPRRTVFPRDLDEAAEPDDRVAEFFAQLLKQARS